VSFMGNNFTYTSSEFGRQDVYITIRSYLRAVFPTGSGARCYDPTDPDLNSTSWFANYMGVFVIFITLDDLTSFVNLHLTTSQRSAALASNIKVLTEQTFQDLGSASSGLTTSQILSVSPLVLVSSLFTLGSVNTWGQDQANIIIQSITSSGFQNVPDSLATEIPPSMLVFTEGTADITVMNKKTWTTDQVTIGNPSFPFGYNLMQFDLCLDIPILKDNLNSICQKVDEDDYQQVILKKLNQAFPTGVPDQAVQMLASVSRTATLEDISKWNISKLDTLAALMKPEDGTWEKAKSKEIITKYLNNPGNSLGSIELNVIDSNLCSLDASTLQPITADSIRFVSA
ncbi:hypothetical protein GOODEAATRI_020191, partial [Goodea atripinnis]